MQTWLGGQPYICKQSFHLQLTFSNSKDKESELNAISVCTHQIEKLVRNLLSQCLFDSQQVSCSYAYSSVSWRSSVLGKTTREQLECPRVVGARSPTGENYREISLTGFPQPLNATTNLSMNDLQTSDSVLMTDQLQLNLNRRAFPSIKIKLVCWLPYRKIIQAVGNSLNCSPLRLAVKRVLAKAGRSLSRSNKLLWT